MTRLRGFLLAAVVALVLMTLGAFPHSAVQPPGKAFTAASGAPVHVVDHHDLDAAARTEVAAVSVLPAADLGCAGVDVATAGLALTLLVGGRRTSVRYRAGPASGRAPPLAV